MNFQNNIVIIFILGCAFHLHAQQPVLLTANKKYNKQFNYKWINEYPEQIILGKVSQVDCSMEKSEAFFFDTDLVLVTPWGRGHEMPGKYFKENLPVLFIRQLQFQNIELNDGILEWIFTGPLGGITVSLSRDSIWLIQRFCDSYSCNKIEEGRLLARRHPDEIWSVARLKYTGAMETLTIISDDKNLVYLYVNGELIVKQYCLQDFSKHQLRVIGDSVSIKGGLFQPKKRLARILVDEKTVYQKMLGWGGITIPTAYHQFSDKGKQIWWKYITDYNLMIHREYPIGQLLNKEMDNWDHMDDASVHYYGDNFPNSEISDFGYIKKMQEFGGMNVFEFWKFPKWIQDDGNVNVGNYCKAMINYCQTAQKATGKAPAIVGIQNEVSQSTEDWHKMTLALRKALDDSGFRDVRIHQQDMGRLEEDGMKSAKAFSSDKKVWSTIDYAATHMYDYQKCFDNPDEFDTIFYKYKSVIGDKPFISTELCVNSPKYQINSYRVALSMARLYHKNLTILNASSIWYCWLLINTEQASFESSRSLFAVDNSSGFIPRSSGYQLRTYGAFSRRIMKGMNRIKVDTNEKNLLCAAFNGDSGNTLVLLNFSLYPLEIELENLGFIPKYIEESSPYFENEIVDARQRKKVVLNPGDIYTITDVLLYHELEGF